MGELCTASVCMSCLAELRQLAVVDQRLGRSVELVHGGQPPVVEEEAGLLEGGVGGEVVDVVADVPELAELAVDVADRGLGRDDVRKALLAHDRGRIAARPRRGRPHPPTDQEAIPMAHRVTFIPGDGVGPELSEATRRVLEATGVEFDWDVQEAGADVMDKYGTPLPEPVLESIRTNGVAIKGPITTPVGTGFRSVNVALRKELDLYACLRPCKSYEGVRSRYDRHRPRDRPREQRGPLRRHRVRAGLAGDQEADRVPRRALGTRRSARTPASRSSRSR